MNKDKVALITGGSKRIGAVITRYFHKKGFKVIMLPMFFSLDKPLKDIYLMAKKQNIPFLIHHHYLRLIDYLKILYLGYRQINIPFNNITLESLDISGLFREIQLQEGFARSVLSVPGSAVLSSSPADNRGVSYFAGAKTTK